MYHFCPIRWTKKKEMGKGMMTRDLSCPPSRGKMNLYHLPGGQFGNAHRNFNVLSLRPRKSTWENLKYSDEFKSMQIHGYNKNSNKKEKHLSRHQRWCWQDPFTQGSVVQPLPCVLPWKNGPDVPSERRRLWRRLHSSATLPWHCVFTVGELYDGSCFHTVVVKKEAGYKILCSAWISVLSETHTHLHCLEGHISQQ